MKTFILPIGSILLAGSILGLCVNGLRSSGKIKIARNYFHVARMGSPSHQAGDSEANTGPSVDSSSASKGTGQSLLDHPFTTLTLEEAIAFYESSEYQVGAVVFIDARDEEHFNAGHIEGAVNVDRYNSDAHLDETVERALQLADVIVVYCGGGECEDSIFLASEMIDERGIPFEKIHLFEGGIQAWESDGLYLEETHSP